MKRSLLTGLLVVLLMGGLFFLTGCGEKKEEKKEENKAAENTATTTNNNQTASTQTVDFYVQNLVPDTTIKELSVSPSGSGEWSPNLLNGLEMPTGTQAQIGIGANNGSTSYDIKVKDEEGTEVTFANSDLSTIFANNGGTIALQIVEGTPVVTIQQ